MATDPEGRPDRAPDHDERFLRYLESLQDATREELNRVDSKAQIVLAVVGVAMSALLAGLFAQSWSPYDLLEGLRGPWWVATGLALCGLALLVYVVTPQTRRVGRRAHHVVAYFEDVARHPGVDELKVALLENASADVDRLVDQIFSISKVVRARYRILQVGMLLVALAAVVYCLVAVIGLLLVPAPAP